MESQPNAVTNHTGHHARTTPPVDRVVRFGLGLLRSEYDQKVGRLKETEIIVRLPTSSAYANKFQIKLATRTQTMRQIMYRGQPTACLSCC